MCCEAMRAPCRDKSSIRDLGELRICCVAAAFSISSFIGSACAANTASLAGVKTFGNMNSNPTETLFTQNETILFEHEVSASCMASPSCAAMMTFIWTTGGKECHGRFVYDNVILREVDSHWFALPLAGSLQR